MNKNIVRIIVGVSLGAVLVFILVFLLRSTPLLWVAFAWVMWALLAFALAMGFWARGRRTEYVLNAAYPGVVGGYLAATLAVSAVFAAIEQLHIFALPYGWFCLIQLAVMAVFAWRLQAMEVGRQAILARETAVKAGSANWKLAVLEISAVAERAAAADRPKVSHAADAVRFADPMEHEAVAQLAAKIGDRISSLGSAVDAGESEKIDELCTEIERLVKERAGKLLLLK